MKLIIDISKDRYDEIMSMDWKNGRRFFDEEIRAIHDGKVLEQEPCEDAVSRQAAINAAIDGADKWDGGFNREREKCIQEEIDKLPSVTPQQKIGKWSRVTDKTGHLVWECDKCGWQQQFNTNYCPDCGSHNE